MARIKTSGFNIPNLDKENPDSDSILDVDERDMKKKLKLKKKRINFDNILPVPNVDSCMGMCTLESDDDKNPFKSLYE